MCGLMGLCLGLLLLAGIQGRASVLVDDFEDISAWSMPGQAIRPSPKAKVGTGALRFLVVPGAEPAWVGRNLPAMDFSLGDVLTFWVKTEGNHTGLPLQVRLQDDQETLAEVAVSALQSRLVSGEWRFVVWPYRLRPGWVHGHNSTMNWTRLVGFHFLGGAATGAMKPVTVTVDEARLFTWAELRQELRADADKRTGNTGYLWSALPQPDPEMMPRFLRRAAQEKLDRLGTPRTAAAVKQMQAQVREGLRRSCHLDGFPQGDLRAETKDVIDEGDHVVEVVCFQSWPGVYVTGVLYRPKARGRYPAILYLMGHGVEAAQSGSLGVPMARHGYVFFAVDVFGGAERGEILPGSGYHGGAPGASLWLCGTPLSGLQVHDNRRALDYLCSRPDVDPERLGVTGASGGGTATLHLAAFDTRVRCAVPSSAAPVTSAEWYWRHHCVCDTLPGHFDFADENRLIATVAPRPLLFIYPSEDTPGQTEESLTKAHDFAVRAYGLLGAAGALRFRRVEGPHGYATGGLDVMLGWFNRWLKGEGDGSPTPIGPPGPDGQPMQAMRYRCFPNDARPPDFLTPAAFMRQRSAEWAAKFPRPPGSAEAWRELRPRLAQSLEAILHLRPAVETQAEPAGPPEIDGAWRVERLILSPEPDLVVPMALFMPLAASAPVSCLVVLSPGGKGEVLDGPWLALAQERRLALAALDLRGMGETGDGSGEGYLQARFHDLCLSSVELGHPLLGQWLTDLRAALDALRARPDLDAQRFYCLGLQETGLLALFAAALDERLAGAAAFGTLASYLSPLGFGRPFMYKEEQPLGGLHSLVPFVPNLLSIGDVLHFAALVAPRPLVLAEAVRGDGSPIHPRWMQEGFYFTERVYQQLEASDRLALLGPGRETEALDHLLRF